MKNNVAEVYKDGTYAGFNPGCGEENTVWKAGQIIRMLQKSKLNPASICEIGCGSGGVIAHLHRTLGAEIQFLGIEPMPEAFRVCSAKASERLHFINGTVEDVAEVFDVVLLLDVFEHVEDYLGFLRSLRHTGRNFIFHIPLDMNAQMVLRDEPIMRVRRSVGHLHYFSKNTALATLEYCGYSVTDWFYSDMRGSSYMNWRTKLLKWPRRILMAASPDFSVRLLGGTSLTVIARPLL